MTTSTTRIDRPMSRMLMTLMLAAAAGAAFFVTKSLSTSSVNQSMETSTDQILADIETMQPSVLWREGKQEEALAEAKKLLQTKSNDAKALMCAGNILCQKVQTQREGLDHLREATILAPDSRWVRLYYARKLSQTKQYEQAEEQYKSLTSKFDQWAVPRYELATVYINESDFPNAQQSDEDALNHDVDNAGRRKELGLLKTINGQADEGLQDFKDGVRREMKQGYASDVEDVMQRNGMDKDKALADAKAASEQYPDDLSLKLKELRMLIANQKFDDAKTEIAAMNKKFPKDAGVPELIAEMALWQKDDATAKTALSDAAKMMKSPSE